MAKNDQALIAEIQEFVTQQQYLRYGFERDAYRNLLFKQGLQWIVWDGASRRFRQKKIKSWIPTPVTNRYAALLDAIVALMLRVDPAMQWTAADQNNETQKSIAETGTEVIKRAKEQTHFRLWRQELATWLVYTGNAWLINHYDPEGGMEMSVPYNRCPTCRHEGLPTEFEEGCPNCQAKEIELALDERGLPREARFTGGVMRTEVASLFEMFFDFQLTQPHEQERILRIKQRPIAYAKTRYHKEVSAKGTTTLSEFYASSLAYMASGAGLAPTSTHSTKIPTFPEHWYVRLPCEDYPNGVYCVTDLDIMLERRDLFCRDHTGKHFLPANHFVFDYIPGSAVGKSVATDLVPKQKQRNELESLIQLITMRMANPVWIVPYGTDVEGFSGQPGSVLKAIQIAPNANAEPKRLPGENVPSSVMQWLDKIDSDMEDISSIYDVLKGNNPPGVTAGYALQLLIERGQSRWGPLFQRWENGMVQWAVQATAYYRELMPADQLLEILGPHGEWELAGFKGEEFTSLNLAVEPGSVKPQSALAERAMIDDLITRGLIDVTDPFVKSEILRSVGMSKYDKVSDWDMKDAAREEEAFLQIARQYPLEELVQEAQEAQRTGNPQAEQMMQQVQTLATGAARFRPQIDNNPIHLWSHRRFAKTDKYRQLSAAWQAVWMKHVEETALRILMESQPQMGQPHEDGAQTPTGGPPSSNGTRPPTGTPPNLPATPQGGHVQNPVARGVAG